MITEVEVVFRPRVWLQGRLAAQIRPGEPFIFPDHNFNPVPGEMYVVRLEGPRTSQKGYYYYIASPVDKFEQARQRMEKRWKLD